MERAPRLQVSSGPRVGVRMFDGGRWQLLRIIDISTHNRVAILGCQPSMGNVVAAGHMSPRESDEQEIVHIDHNKKNDAVVNLRWANRSQATVAGKQPGLRAVWMLSQDGKERLAWFPSARDAASALGMVQGTVIAACHDPGRVTRRHKVQFAHAVEGEELPEHMKWKGGPASDAGEAEQGAESEDDWESEEPDTESEEGWETDFESDELSE